MSATPPDVDAVMAYIGTGLSYDRDEIGASLASETLAQARVCNIPDEPSYPADLATALCRRVARALQMKSKPLGYEPGAEGGLSYISAYDSEIRRLEAPFRKRPIR